MPRTTTSGSSAKRPRVGIPWRTAAEERNKMRQKLDYYFEAVRKAGAQPMEISLQQSPTELHEQLRELDAFVLPGSPADVDPTRYDAPKHAKTNELDAKRDSTDVAILDHALAAAKPVLAICYGCQLLNVYRHGTLIQDLPSERGNRPNRIAHGSTDLAAGAKPGDQSHGVSFLADSRLGQLSGAGEGVVNSSHHQAIDRPGKDLRVTAKATDGTIEGVEWTGDSNWVVGVQWHPERMAGDAFAERLFADFVAAARQSLSGHAADSVVEKT
jgi:putative glutamine amidotransferase